MKIRDVMKPRPWTAHGDETMADAYRRMTHHGVRHLPVVDGDKLTGILTERDVMAFRAGVGESEDWWRAPVARAMSRPPQTAHPDDSVTEVAGRLAAAKIGALPVVERGHLIGLVTAADILGAEVHRSMQPAPPTLATAGDIMTRAPVTARPDEPLLDAAVRLVDRGVRHLPVIDERGAIAGMLSDRDLRDVVGDPVPFVYGASKERDLRVRDAMAEAPVTVREDRPVVELARLFADTRLGAFPVLGDDGHLSGIVSYVDVLRRLIR